MGTTLTGLTPATTYDALLKTTDNQPLTSTRKVITDGLGNDSALSLATTSASITGTLAVSSTLTPNAIQLPSLATPAFSEGLVWYDSTEKSLAFYNDSNLSPVYVGENIVLKVYNNTGSTIAKGSAVYIQAGGAFTYPNVALARADSPSTAAVIGLMNAATPTGTFGYVTSAGAIGGLNTGTYTEGGILYLSPYSAGQLMSTVPPTGYVVQVGVVAHVNSSNGIIYTKQTTPLAISANIIVGELPVNRGGTGSATASGAKANLSAENILTFSSPLSRAVDTISINQATTETNGYLSSTDWNTFNSKQNLLINPITGTSTRTAEFLTKFSATNTITNSDIYKSGLTYFIGAGNSLNVASGLQVIYSEDGYTLDVTGGVVSVLGEFTTYTGTYRLRYNDSGLNLGARPILGATTLAMNGALTGATNITASGTLNVGSTTTATKRLEISGDNSGNAENNTLRFVNTDTTISANEVIGKIEFFSADVSSPSASVKAYISAGATTTSPQGYLDFATDELTGTPTVKQRIQANGRVLIGSTTDNATTNLLQVNGGLDYNIVMRATSGTAITLALTDKGKFFETTAAASIAITIPTNASVAFPIGTQIWFVQGGNGVPTFSGDTGVTLRTRSVLRQPFARFAEVKLTKTGTDEWYLTGDLKA